jgi:glycerol-3-phosphate dehydrogenase subunit B
LGGGIVADRFGNIRENIFNFPCVGPATQSDWFSPQFLNYSGQAVFLSGVAVNREMKPIDPLDKTIYDNLAIAGTTLSGGDYLREGSMEGVDLVSAYKIAGSVAA